MDAVQVITDFTVSNLFTDQKYILEFMLSSIISHASFNFLDVPVHLLSWKEKKLNLLVSSFSLIFYESHSGQLWNIIIVLCDILLYKPRIRKKCGI